MEFGANIEAFYGIPEYLAHEGMANGVKRQDLAAEFIRHVYDDDFINAERFFHRIDEQDRKMIIADKKKVNPMVFFAAGEGNTAMVEFLVKECQASIEEGGEYFFDSRQLVTPLWCAAGNGRFEVVKLLQELGADINAVSYSGTTSVNYACSKRQTETVKFLVKQGADINRSDERGYNCLMNSVPCLELCQFLIANGARVNEQDKLGNTALHHAITNGSLKIVQLLLDHGSDPNIENNLGDDALQLASLHGSESIVMELKFRQKPTPLRWIESLQLLGSYFLITRNSLWQAFDFWRKSVKFQRSNPCVELRKIESMPVFMNVKEVNTREELEDLCEDQEMINMYALEKLLRILGPGHKETTHGLVNVSEVFAKNGNFSRRFDILKFAFHRLQDCSTLTWTEEYLLVLKMLRIACSESFRETRFQIEFQDIFEILDVLTSRAQSASTLHLNGFDISDFMQLIISFVFSVIKLDKTTAQLISFKRTVHRLVRCQMRDEDGQTILHYAVEHCDTYPGVVEVLLECGADVNSVDARHNTALHICSRPFTSFGSAFGSVLQKEKKKVIKFLLQYSAHPDIVNDNGDSAGTGLPLNMLDHVNLKCLAAAVIRDNRIPYKGQILESLESFVQMHGRCPSRNYQWLCMLAGKI